MFLLAQAVTLATFALYVSLLRPRSGGWLIRLLGAAHGLLFFAASLLVMFAKPVAGLPPGEGPVTSPVLTLAACGIASIVLALVMHRGPWQLHLALLLALPAYGLITVLSLYGVVA